MPNLVLNTTCHNVYSDLEVCAYLNFGTKDQPTDHLGNTNEIIGQSEKVRLTYEKYMRDTILPKIKTRLAHTQYEATDVAFDHMAVHPYIAIRNLNKKSIPLSEIEDIAQLVQSEINLYNKTNTAQELPKVSDKKQVLFAANTSTEEKNTAATLKKKNLTGANLHTLEEPYRYNTRSKKQ